MEAQAIAVENPFRAAEEQFERVVALLRADKQLQMQHDELEVLMQREGSEVLRLLLQGHFDLRGARVSAGPVIGADGVERTHRRVRAVPLKTVVGKVQVPRQPCEQVVVA